MMSKSNKKEEKGMEKYAVVQDPKEKEATEKAKKDIEKAKKPKK
tara:strand:- start:134 stop:265 length:132 start_codon:yes stop_codon:yes gene_type:complete